MSGEGWSVAFDVIRNQTPQSLGDALRRASTFIDEKTRARILLRDHKLNILGIDNNILSFDCSRTENAQGAFTLVTPMCRLYDSIGIDYIIELQRSFDGGKTWINDLETAWFVRAITIEQKGKMETLTLTGHDGLGLFQRRILSWFTVKNTELEQNYYSIKYMPAHLMMQEVFEENVTAAIYNVAPDDIPGSAMAMRLNRKVFPYFRVDNPVLSSPVVKVEFAWKTLLDALRSISEAAMQESARLLYDVRFDSEQSMFIFMIRSDILGRDRSKEILFSIDAGNVSSLSMVKDHNEEITWIHVGGEGQNDLKLYEGYGTYDDNDRPFYPIEGYVDAQNSKNDPEILERRGRHELAVKTPRWIFRANAIDTPWCRFGQHYHFGDRVTVQHRGLATTCRISKIRLMYEAGKFTLDLPLETEEII